MSVFERRRMNKIVLISIGVIIISILAYISFQSAKNVSTSVVQQQAEVTVEPTVEPSGTTVVPSTAQASTLVTGITLSISSPVNNSTVANSSVAVKGKTVANADVFVNDTETKADGNGNFSVTLSLDEGENYILIVANDVNGNYSEKDLTITYTP